MVPRTTIYLMVLAIGTTLDASDRESERREEIERQFQERIRAEAL